MDVTLDWLDGVLDVALADDGDLATDDGLRTAVALSLLCDRRAEPDDVLPDGSTDRRGWWADAIADQDGDKWGSRLWLLNREKTLPEVRRAAEAYAREALAWLLEDGVATEVEAISETLDRDVLWLRVIIQRGDGTRLADRYQYVWR
ncbi:phage GP46 family protein [Halomonas salina]|nr:phage GP46 family protein [Halomonas salina]